MNADRIEAAAAHWVMRRDDSGWSDDDQRELDAWLEESMAHKAAFWRLEHGWKAVGRLAATAVTSRPEQRSRPSFWRKSAYLAIAASLLLAFGLTMFVHMSGLTSPSVPPQTFATRLGERQAIALEDGSRVEINTGTQLRAALTGQRREIWLDRGEAYFEVAHDAARPFTVHAGQNSVTVLGTKFSVRLDRGRLQVAVSEGRVRIDRPAEAGRSTTIARGDLAVADGNSLLVAENSVERIDGNLSWRRGMLTFEQSSLAEAAYEFNRYNRRRIVVTDPAIASLRIGGSFRSDNIEAFGRLLRDAYGLQVEFTTDEIRIVG